MYWHCALVVAWLVPRETAAVSAQALWTPYNHAPVYSVFIQSNIRRVHVCLAVTWHLYFWQNVRDLLRAAAVTRGRNGYRNKSQHRKLTMEEKILPPLMRDSNPGLFDQESFPLAQHDQLSSSVIHLTCVSSFHHQSCNSPVWLVTTIGHVTHLCDQISPSVM